MKKKTFAAAAIAMVMTAVMSSTGFAAMVQPVPGPAVQNSVAADNPTFAPVQRTAENPSISPAQQMFTVQTAAQNPVQNPGSGMPAFRYAGNDPYLPVICEYLKASVAPAYAQGQVMVPGPVILDEDDSNPNDIRIYGNFWVYQYNVNSGTGYLDMIAGGGMPGCIHLARSGNGYVITSVEQAKDGAAYSESLRRICGDRAGLYNKFMAGDMEGKRVGAKMEFLRMYLNSNGMNYKGYQDVGFSPVNIWS